MLENANLKIPFRRLHEIMHLVNVVAQVGFEGSQRLTDSGDRRLRTWHLQDTKNLLTSWIFSLNYQKYNWKKRKKSIRTTDEKKQLSIENQTEWRLIWFDP